jgi:hypothetical protein
VTNRIIRGFYRLGFAAAVLVALAGVVATWIVTIDRYEHVARQSAELATAQSHPPAVTD